MRIHYPNWTTQAITALISCLLISGCSKQLIPDSGPDILDVYEQHMTKSAPVSRMLRAVESGRRDLTGYTRTAGNELETLFPKLANPELVMYVYPHMTARGRPIPGYSTSFTLFEADQYALPGEVSP